MDPRLLDYYELELQHVLEGGAEFARDFPKIASRLGMEGIEVADPYVERLLEGFAFLAARLHLRLDSQYPVFTQHLLELVYPHYLSPTPSCAVVRFQPVLDDGALAQGFPIARGTSLKSRRDGTTACEYRTAHEVRLYPVEIASAEYVTYSRDLDAALQHGIPDVQAALRLRLRATGGLTFEQIALESLVLYLKGAGDVAMRLYEQIHGRSAGVLVQSTTRQDGWSERLPPGSLRRVGFDEDQALLPAGPRSFSGYRLLQEYFAFPERFMFAEITGLRPALRRARGTEVEVVVLFHRVEQGLLNNVDVSNFELNCVPAVNLFPMRCDNIQLTGRTAEYHVIPDRTRPMDFEVSRITSLTGSGAGETPDREFRQFYATKERSSESREPVYYTVRREPRLLSEHQKRTGQRAGYVGSEVYIALVDTESAPYSPDLKQLSVAAICTNRDLPLTLSLGAGRSDFSLSVSAPVESVRCVAGPTEPRPSRAGGKASWRLISHLALNHLSLVDDGSGRSGASLREILLLYANEGDAAIRKQIEGLKSVSSSPVIRRIPTPGPITFGRGLEVSVTFDESAFRGTGVFLLGAVLEDFFARYVSINAFTEAVILTLERGEVMRWPPRAGRVATL